MKNGLVEYDNGDKFWHLNGKCHREDGPAIEHANGDKFWYLNSERHREDGPAVEYANGPKFWYLNDIEYTKQTYYEELYNSGKITKEELFIGLLV